MQVELDAMVLRTLIETVGTGSNCSRVLLVGVLGKAGGSCYS